MLSSHGKEDKTAITRPSSTISKIGCSLSLALIFSINPRASLFFYHVYKEEPSVSHFHGKELITQHVAIVISFHIYSKFYFLPLKKSIIPIILFTIFHHDRCQMRRWCLRTLMLNGNLCLQVRLMIASLTRLSKSFYESLRLLFIVKIVLIDGEIGFVFMVYLIRI